VAALGVVRLGPSPAAGSGSGSGWVAGVDVVQGLPVAWQELGQASIDQLLLLLLLLLSSTRQGCCCSHGVRAVLDAEAGGSQVGWGSYGSSPWRGEPSSCWLSKAFPCLPTLLLHHEPLLPWAMRCRGLQPGLFGGFSRREDNAQFDALYAALTPNSYWCCAAVRMELRHMAFQYQLPQPLAGE
jgi:hypothetical protein